MSEETDAGEAFDCNACGACCRYAGEVIVDRLDAVPAHLTRPAHGAAVAPEAGGGLVFMARAPGGQCIALQGDIGSSCRCSIYDVRPSVCRDFAAGSIACRGSRSAVVK